MSNKARRPNFQIRDLVVLAPGVRVPATNSHPALLVDTVLRVSSLSGRGTLRDPWTLNVTDGFHFWGLDPDAFRLASSITPDDGIYDTVRKQMAAL